MSAAPEVRVVRLLPFLVVILTLAVCAGGQAVELSVGRGQPDLGGWCALDWLAGCTEGVAVLSGSGLVLYAGQIPPSAFELSLKLIPYRSLLFVLESPSTIGRISVQLDGVEQRSIPIAIRGQWWVRLTDLPETGILRIEPDKYCEQLTIRSVNFPCPPCPPGLECQDCRRDLILGAVLGALLGALVCWLILR
jgi:hypothetical protein